MNRALRRSRNADEFRFLPRLSSSAKLSLATALQNSTTGVALFDQRLRCTAINPALAVMCGLASAECVGKSVHEILRGQTVALDEAFEQVRETQHPVRNVLVSIRATKGAIARVWVADLFPLCDVAGFLKLVGIAFCEEPSTSVQQRDLLDSTNGKPVTIRRKRRVSRSAEIEDVCGPLIKRTFSLIADSMSLRRRMSERRLSASLTRNSWPTVAEEPPVHSQEEAADGGRALSLLSLRETEVVQHLAAGRSNKEIAALLRLSTRTVETYRARLMAKLGLHTLADLVRYAVRQGLIRV